MKTSHHKFLQVTPFFAAGALICAFSFNILDDADALSYEPNPAALAKSPYGRTVGMALQGPITRFWDRGVGAIEKKAELTAGDRPDQKLFNFVTQLREEKADTAADYTRSDEYQDYAMARIEQKLALAWEMDPRNFANYAIYQMFVWEGFSKGLVESQYEPRELSLRTLEVCEADEKSPMSTLTAGQAAYDLVFTARLAEDQPEEERLADIAKYGEKLPELITEFDNLVAEMKNNGSWDALSEVKQQEFFARKTYLEKLNRETRNVFEKYNLAGTANEGGSEL